MRLIRIYTEQPLDAFADYELEPAAAHHLANVLRLKAGDRIVAFDGRGGEYPAEITAARKGAVSIRTAEHNAVDRESPLSIHVYQGISRGDRMDFAIQKACELGAEAITPVFCERSQTKLDAKRLQKKQEHWQQIAISACQQSWRCHITPIAQSLGFNEALEQFDSSQPNYIFDTNASVKLSDSLQQQNSIAIWIGPEGGFSESEVELALARGCQAISLGPRILRTETATVAALSLCQYLAGDFS